MNKSEFFLNVRRFVESRCFDSAGLIPANSVVTVGDYEFAIEGRGRGMGYVTVDWRGQRIASEFAQHGIWNEQAAIAAQAVIAPQSQFDRLHSLTLYSIERGYRAASKIFAAKLASHARQMAADTLAFGDEPELLLDIRDERNQLPKAA